MNDKRNHEQWREAGWRPHPSPADEARLRAWLAAHPEDRAEALVEEALNRALGRLPDAPMPGNFTARVLQAAQLAAALGEKVYTIGIGIEEPYPLYAFDPATGKLLFDPQGNLIPSMTLQPANYSVLGKMAALSKAKFYRATNRRELQSIYNDIDRLEKTEVKLRRFTSYRPLFQWPLLAAFGLFTLEMLLSNTRLRRVP